MKHIETTSEEEKKARNDYKELKASEKPVVADEKLEATVRELLALRHKMDEDALRASELKAIIMNAMKHSPELKGKDGTLLVSWVQGNQSKNVDYKGLFKKFGIKDEDVAAFTTFKTASRTFSIELD